MNLEAKTKLQQYKSLIEESNLKRNIYPQKVIKILLAKCTIKVPTANQKSSKLQQQPLYILLYKAK